MEKEIYAVFPESLRAEAEAELEALGRRGFSYAFREESGGDDTERLTRAACLLVILGEAEDNAPVKQDLNLALDRHIPVAVLYFGEPVLDPGLIIQLGLAERFRAGEKDRDRVEAALREILKAEEEKTGGARKHRGLTIFLTLLFAAALGTACWFVLPKYFPAFSGKGEEKLTDMGETEDSAPETGSAAVPADLGGAIREALLDSGADLDGDGVISGEEVKKVTKLDLSGLGLTDASDLALFTELRELDLSGNRISDVSPLAALTKLKKLDLRGNPVKDLRILEFLPELEVIETE